MIDNNEIFQLLYFNTDDDRKFITLDMLETLSGIEVAQIRKSLADLKEQGFAIEEERGVQITATGITEAGTRWV